MKKKIGKNSKKGFLFLAIAAVIMIVGIYYGVYSQYFISGTVGTLLILSINQFRK